MVGSKENYKFDLGVKGFRGKKNGKRAFLILSTIFLFSSTNGP